MLVSFIIPVFKPDSGVFKKCLKSLVDQSHKDWEAIVVFDGKDSTAEMIAESLNDKRIKVFTINNVGVQKARNFGATKAKGEIYWFWDCDCIIEPDTCKTFVDELEKDPTIDFVYSGYKFIGENGGIPSEPFDPWLLKSGNYISTCFPMRKSVFPGWDESLKSLQDWDIWLTITGKGSKGLYMQGYAFSTLLPSNDSISGQNCLNTVWLDRVKAIQDKHNLPNNKICVSSLSNKAEGIRLAKLIGADYKDVPNYKPNNYDTVIQVGFSLHPKRIMHHVSIFNQELRKKVIFFTYDDVAEINNAISLKALNQYSGILNSQAMMFVEDMDSKKIMERAGFKVTILPMPMVNADPIDMFPSENRVLVDISPEYEQLMTCLVHSLPDIEFDFKAGNKPIKDYCAYLTLRTDNSMSFPLKRMLLTGRNVISNIQSPFCGYVDDKKEVGKYVSDLVDTIRKRVRRETGAAVGFWNKQLQPTKLMEVLK